MSVLFWVFVIYDLPNWERKHKPNPDGSWGAAGAAWAIKKKKVKNSITLEGYPLSAESTQWGYTALDFGNGKDNDEDGEPDIVLSVSLPIGAMSQQSIDDLNDAKQGVYWVRLTGEPLLSEDGSSPNIMVKDPNHFAIQQRGDEYWRRNLATEN